MNTRRKALITGASSGIGRATALRFAADGYDVCLNAQCADRLQQLQPTLGQGDHLLCPGDYSDPAVVERLQQLLQQRWGHLDVLINCAGVFAGADAIGSPVATWRRPFDTMIEGAIGVTRVSVPLMRADGRIIHVTSIHAGRAEVGAAAYAMAKAALNQYCRGLAVELAPQGILVNAIAPGFVDTEMSIRADGVNELTTDWFRANYVDGHHLPLRRAGRPEEIAGVAAFLAGPDATYITGQVLTVDGGLTITF